MVGGGSVVRMESDVIFRLIGSWPAHKGFLGTSRFPIHDSKKGVPANKFSFAGEDPIYKFLGAVHLLCHTILASSGPPPPSVLLRHNLACMTL